MSWSKGNKLNKRGVKAVAGIIDAVAAFLRAESNATEAIRKVVLAGQGADDRDTADARGKAVLAEARRQYRVSLADAKLPEGVTLNNFYSKNADELSGAPAEVLEAKATLNKLSTLVSRVKRDHFGPAKRGPNAPEGPDSDAPEGGDDETTDAEGEASLDEMTVEEMVDEALKWLGHATARAKDAEERSAAIARFMASAHKVGLPAYPEV